ncbi:hypothetical protein TURU_114693 [Turdus rufiventris]|nr:hypothetical protein TURU_114693 [Turdus rufiventris]
MGCLYQAEGEYLMNYLAETHTNTNGDPGPKVDHFLEKALGVKELDHHISLSTLGSAPGERKITDRKEKKLYENPDNLACDSKVLKIQTCLV